MHKAIEVMAHKSLRTTIYRALSAIGNVSEAEFYAKLFQGRAPEQFALIVIAPACLKKPLQSALISDLKILSQLNLTPLLLIGPLCADQTQIKFYTHKLSKALDQAGILASQLNCASYEFTSGVRKIARAGQIPILELNQTLRGMDFPGLVKTFKPSKVIFLQPSGGLHKNGRRIADLKIDDIDGVMDDLPLSSGQKRSLSLIKDISAPSEDHMTSVIASPLNLLSELFTTKGSGTLIRKGASIRIVNDIDQLDREKLAVSVESAFAKPLKFSFFNRPFYWAAIEDGYRGGACVEKLAGNAYLSKFWVTPEAQGEGIARDIWRVVRDNHKVLFWRSKKDNPFNDWYMKTCDGMQVSGHWRVFWIGLDAFEISKAIKAAGDAPIDFEEE